MLMKAANHNVNINLGNEKKGLSWRVLEIGVVSVYEGLNVGR